MQNLDARKNLALCVLKFNDTFLVHPVDRGTINLYWMILKRGFMTIKLIHVLLTLWGCSCFLATPLSKANQIVNCSSYLSVPGLVNYRSQVQIFILLKNVSAASIVSKCQGRFHEFYCGFLRPWIKQRMRIPFMLILVFKMAIKVLVQKWLILRGWLLCLNCWSWFYFWEKHHWSNLSRKLVCWPPWR